MLNSANNTIKWSVFVLSFIGYISIAYLFPRSDFWLLISCFSALFAGYFYFISKNASFTSKEVLQWSIFFRIILLFSIPSLSDDFNRYLWDGEMSTQGINPYLYTPTEAIKFGINGSNELYTQMNSPSFYSVYPPTNQLFFAIASFLGFGSWEIATIIFKALILLCETASLILINNISLKFKKGNLPLLLYGLNPLVILEITGNGHTEGIMVCFVLMTIWSLISNQKIWRSALLFAFAICSKLLPVLLLPLFIKKIGWKHTLIFSSLSGLFSIILFTPFINTQTFQNIGEGLALYFNYFEFNGWLYNSFKYIDGFWYHGAIHILKVIMILLMLWTYIKSSSKFSFFFDEGLLLFSIYYLTSSTIHPWYIAGVVVYAAFSKSKYWILWTALIPWTYITYQTDHYEQNTIVITIQFFAVTGWFIGERFFYKKEV